MNERLQAIEAEIEKVLSLLEGMEAASRHKLDKQSDAEAVERIVSMAGYE